MGLARALVDRGKDEVLPATQKNRMPASSAPSGQM